jgi:hypothetical protein
MNYNNNNNVLELQHPQPQQPQLKRQPFLIWYTRNTSLPLDATGNDPNVLLLALESRCQDRFISTDNKVNK